MNKIIAAIIFLSSIISYSQVTQQWVARYNNPRDSNDAGRTMAVDASGNVYVGGWSIGLNSTDTSYDFVTIKYNSSGIVQWLQHYNGTGHSYDAATDIALDISGNVFVTGISTGVGSFHDIVTIKYDTAGVQQWVQRYNGPANDIDQPVSLVLDDSGNAYVAGKSSWVFNNIDYATIKYNSAGVQQWVQRYNSPNNSWDVPLSMDIDNSSNIIITGYSNGGGSSNDIATIKYSGSGVELWVSRFNGTGNDYDIGYAVFTDALDNVFVGGYTQNLNSTGTDFVTLKYNSTGVQQWVQTYNGPGNYGDVIYSIVTDALGNIIVTGSSNGSGNNNDYATIKYNPSGVQQWVQRYSGPGNSNDVPWSIAVDIYGSVYVTGWGGGDYATVKYSSSGIEQWLRTYNGTGGSFDGADKVVLDTIGNVYVTGRSIGSGNSDEDCVTIKYSQPIGIEPMSSQVPYRFSLSQNYPNPFNPTTKIKFEIPNTKSEANSKSEIRIYDVLAREVAILVNEQLLPGTYEVEWDASNYPSGVYFYKLSASDFVDIKKMMIVK